MAGVVGTGCATLIARGEHRAALALAFVWILFAGLERDRAWPAVARAGFLAFLLVGSAGFCVEIAHDLGDNLREPPEWDFVGFWLHARTAVLGQNFYDAANARELALDLPVGEEFEQEIVATGFWYPPPSMFFFLPLGWLELHPALMLWYALQLACLAACVFLLWQICFPRGSPVELAACLALVCACDGTLSTMGHAQTTFTALLALLLFWRRRQVPLGGLWACVAMLVKPFLAVLAVWLVGARRWRALGGFLLGTAAFAIASIAVFGGDVFVDSFTRMHAEPKPGWIFSETSNQSALAWVLRATHASCEGAGCVANPIFLVIAGVLTTVTGLLVLAIARTHEEWAISLCVLLALLVYPVSQAFYSVLLIPALLVAWRDRAQPAGWGATLGLVGAAVYALATLDQGKATVLATALLWSVMASHAARQAWLQRNGR